MADEYQANELPDSPSGEVGESPRFTRRFLVLAPSKSTTITDLKSNTTGLPKYLSPYGSTISRAKTYRWERKAPGSEYWVCEVDYGELESESGDPSESNSDPENPLADLPEIQLTFEETSEPILYTGTVEADYGGGIVSGNFQGILNSAGEPFNPPPMKAKFHPKLTISRNEDIATDIMQVARDFIGKTNSAIFWGAAPGQVMIRNISATPFFRQDNEGGGTPYIKVTYDFIFADTWDLVLLDIGTFYFDADQNKIQFEANGQPTLGLLDGAGGALPTPVAPTDAVFLPPKRLYDSENFDLLQLPTSFTVAKKKKDKI